MFKNLMPTAKRDEIMILSTILKIVAFLSAVAALGILCYQLGRCHERLEQGKKQLDEIRARIARDKKSIEDVYRLIEETREDERQ